VISDYIRQLRLRSVATTNKVQPVKSIDVKYNEKGKRVYFEKAEETEKFSQEISGSKSEHPIGHLVSIWV